MSKKIREVIEKVQAPVGKAIDWVINKAYNLVKAAGKLLGFGKDKKDEKADPEHDKKVQAGLDAIEQEEQKYLKDGKIEQEDAEKVASTVKSNHPIFKSIKVVDAGGTWDYDYVASSGKKKGKSKKSIKPKGDGKDYERILKGKLLDLTDYMNPPGNQFPARTLSPSFKSPKDSKNRTNLERSKAGLTAFLPNGDFVELHHRDQSFFSPLDEHSHSFHQSVVDDPDYHPFAGDPGYLSWRGEVAEVGGVIKTLGEIYNNIRRKYWKGRF